MVPSIGELTQIDALCMFPVYDFEMEQENGDTSAY